MDPITYPTVTIGSQPLTLKFRLKDLFDLKARGIDVFITPDPPLKGLDALERTLKILAAGLSEAAAKAGIVGGVNWEDLTPEFDMTQLAALSETIAAAMGKVSTQAAAIQQASTQQIQ